MTALNLPAYRIPRTRRRAERRWGPLAHKMGRLFTANGILFNSSGIVYNSSGGVKCCMYQARKCSDNTLVSLYVDKSQFPAFPATAYFKNAGDATCYYVTSSDGPYCNHTPVSPTFFADCTCSGAGVSCSSCPENIPATLTLTIAGVTMAAGGTTYYDGKDTSGGGIAIGAKLDAGSTANGAFSVTNGASFSFSGNTCAVDTCGYLASLSGGATADEYLGHCGAYTSWAGGGGPSDTNVGYVGLKLNTFFNFGTGQWHRVVQVQAAWFNVSLPIANLTVLGFIGQIDNIIASGTVSCAGTYTVANQLTTLGIALPNYGLGCPTIGDDGGVANPFSLFCSPAGGTGDEFVAGTGGTATFTLP